MKPEEAAFPARKEILVGRVEYMVFTVNVLLSFFVRDHFSTQYCLLVLILLL